MVKRVETCRIAGCNKVGKYRPKYRTWLCAEHNKRMRERRRK